MTHICQVNISLLQICFAFMDLGFSHDLVTHSCDECLGRAIFKLNRRQLFEEKLIHEVKQTPSGTELLNVDLIKPH